MSLEMAVGTLNTSTGPIVKVAQLEAAIQAGSLDAIHDERARASVSYLFVEFEQHPDVIWQCCNSIGVPIVQAYKLYLHTVAEGMPRVPAWEIEASGAITKQQRANHVAWMLANGRLEGLEPDSEHKNLLTAYIAGSISLDHLLEHAIAAAIVASDDGQAAQAHLAAGRPIYYCEDAFPEEMVRKWPDGRRELVKVDREANVTHARPYVSDNINSPKELEMIIQPEHLPLYEKWKAAREAVDAITHKMHANLSSGITDESILEPLTTEWENAQSRERTLKAELDDKLSGSN